MRNQFFVFTALILLTTLFSINTEIYEFAYADEDNLIVSPKSREQDPEVTEKNLSTLVNGNCEFAFDLYQTLKDTPGNIIFSPYTISHVFAMTWYGARAHTEKNMGDTFHFFYPKKEFHKAFNKLDSSLVSHGQKLDIPEFKDWIFGMALDTANSIWAQGNYVWEEDFLDTLMVNYGAGIHTADFKNEPEQCRKIINKWIEKETNGRFSEAITEGEITDLMRIVLVNSLYYSAVWDGTFRRDKTTDDNFTLLDGSRINVTFMNQRKTHKFVEGDGYKAVELDYKQAASQLDTCMIVILPDLDVFHEFEARLNDDLLHEIINNMTKTKLSLTFPKLDMECMFDLRGILREMGMPDAFTWGTADFSGMTHEESLFISLAKHAAFITIDELGTRAGAISIVGGGGAAASPLREWIELKVDHPYIFLIRDKNTGTILFLGRVLDPR